jgi:hypothetical protein
VFSVGATLRLYNENLTRLKLKPVEFRNASLPGYELWSRGIEASEVLSAVQLRLEGQPVKRRLHSVLQ